MNNIHSYVRDKKFFILHVRETGGSNSKHDIYQNVWYALDNWLTEQGYKVWYILASDIESMKSKNKLHISTLMHSSEPFYKYEAFRRYKVHNGLTDTLDLGKLLHLNLLLKVYDMSSQGQLMGIIGNTSGTLDTASTTGHKVFNLHHMKNNDIFTNPQHLRIYLQTNSLTLGVVDMDKLKDDIHIITVNEYESYKFNRINQLTTMLNGKWLNNNVSTISEKILNSLLNNSINVGNKCMNCLMKILTFNPRQQVTTTNNNHIYDKTHLKAIIRNQFHALSECRQCKQWSEYTVCSHCLVTVSIKMCHDNDITITIKPFTIN